MSSFNSRKLNRLINIALSLSDGMEKELINTFSSVESCRKQWQNAEMELAKNKELGFPHQEEISSLKVQLELARDQLDVALRKRPLYEKRIQLLEQQLHAINHVLNDMVDSDIKGGVDRNTLLQMTAVDSNDKPPLQTPMSVNYRLKRKSVIPSDVDSSAEETVFSEIERCCSRAKSLNRKNYVYTERENQCYTNNVPSPKKHADMDSRLPHDHASDSTSPRLLSLDISKREALPKPNITVKSDEIPNQVIMDTPASNPYVNHQSDYPMHHINDDSRMTNITSPVGVVEPSAPSWQDHQAFVGKNNMTSLYPDFNEHELVLPPRTHMEEAKPSVVVSKPHTLVQRTAKYLQKCSVCKTRIGLTKNFLRCQDCKMKCHAECKVLISTSCDSCSFKLCLEDFIIPPNSNPQVPKFLIDCVREIERRGLNQQGLYRVSGSVKEVKELKKKWTGNGDVDLRKINDIHVVAGALKQFIKSMSDPLISRHQHNIFMEAAEKNDMPTIYKMIENLPCANRHTLAFLIIHLRKVVRVQENLMDFKALARVLGPTIIGSSSCNPSNSRLYEESRLQPILLECLLGISDDYWELILASSQKNHISQQKPNHHHQPSIPPSLPDSPKSNKDTSFLMDSPLLGRIDNRLPSVKKGGAPRKTTNHASLPPKTLIDKLGMKKFFDEPTLVNK